MKYGISYDRAAAAATAAAAAVLLLLLLLLRSGIIRTEAELGNQEKKIAKKCNYNFTTRAVTPASVGGKTNRLNFERRRVSISAFFQTEVERRPG